MARLVAFGCSYTAGASLDDNHHLLAEEAVPSIYAWPNILANMLGRRCVNNAVNGSGNLEILWKILNTKFKSNDIVCVGWSHFTRDIIFDQELDIKRVHSDDNNLSKHWLLTHTDYDINIRNWLHIHHADVYLKTLGITTYHSPCAFDVDISTKPTCINIDNFTGVRFTNLDLGFDNAHPGMKSQEEFAKQVYKYITTSGQAGP